MAGVEMAGVDPRASMAGAADTAGLETAETAALNKKGAC